MSDGCPKCDENRACGYNFCIACGRDLTDPLPVKTNEPEPVDSYDIMFIAAMAATLITTVIGILAIIYCIANISNISYYLTSFGMAEFSLALVIYAFCLAYAAIRFAYRLTEKDPERRNGLLMDSGLMNSAIGLAVMFFASIALIILVSLVDPVENNFLDDYNEYQLAAVLMIAGPEEEFLFRILPVGIPMVLIALIKGRERVLKYLFGGFGMSRAALILIIVSAVIFGLAHLSGWNFSKVPQSVMCGLIFGYVYVEYGVYASIIVHGTLDVFNIPGYMWDPINYLEYGMIFLGFVLMFHVFRQIPRMREYETSEHPYGLFEMWRRH